MGKLNGSHGAPSSQALRRVTLGAHKVEAACRARVGRSLARPAD